MISHASNLHEFNTHIIPQYSNYPQNKSDILPSNSIHTKLQMEQSQKFSITALFVQLNMYVLYVFNYLLSFLYSLLSSPGSERRVSLR